MKIVKVLFCLILLVSFGLYGCHGEEPVSTENEFEKVDYSQYDFTDVIWTRDTEVDVEYIAFKSDGSFRYSCACGNPVNDADMCQGYVYDDNTKTIKLDYFETTDETITTITILSCDEELLVLDFDGEQRSFTREGI